MKRMFTAALLLLSGSSALIAQNEIDVLRYSYTGFGGTARYVGMGGAFGALGADMSVMCNNPAGVALYRRNELVITPSLFTQSVTSTYNNTVADDYRSNFRIDNFGVVFAGRTENVKEVGWQSLAFGITYNRFQSFQANLRMNGSSNTSQLDAWRNGAAGTGPSGLNAFSDGMAWNVYLLDPFPGDSTRYVDVIPDGNIVQQQKRIETRGSMGEWTFAIGGNYSERLYIGASVGLPRVRYEELSTYSETEDSSNTPFKSFEFQQSLETRGNGFNLRAGFIYRATDHVRMGFSVQTPSVLRLNDAYSATMTSVIGSTTRQNSSPDGEFDYVIRTPLRAQGSLAVILGKMGLVSLDYEYIDYTDGRLRSSDYAFTDENNAVRQKYKAAQNIRLGGEVRLTPISIRGGFAYYGNPYSDRVNNKTARISLSAGLGYRDPNDTYYFDFALINTRQTENYYFYTPDLVNPVENKWSSVSGVLTVGFRY